MYQLPLSNNSFNMLDTMGNSTMVNATPFDPVAAAKAKIKEIYIGHCKNDPLPSARTIVQNMDTSGLVLHVVLIVMATLTVAIFIEEVFYLKSNLKLSYRRRLSILQAGIPPVFAVSSVVGCFFPAGNVMIDFVCSVYFGIGLHALLLLMLNYYGGLQQFLLRFEGSIFLEISTRTHSVAVCSVSCHRLFQTVLPSTMERHISSRVHQTNRVVLSRGRWH
uniref:Uncharacterized protein n=1 Tax=Ciona savignyi TaxID=51511 RepID=H2Y7V6_CIOSA